MKKINIFVAIFVLNVCALNAQSFRIEVKTPNLPADSLFICAYNSNTTLFKPIYGVKYAEEVVFFDNKSLRPGLYLINADTNIVVEFIISDNQQQQFSIDIKNNDAVFYGSAENTANMQYRKSIQAYDQQIAELNSEILQIQRSNALDEKRAKVDSIFLEINEINLQKLAYQSQIAEENKGSLLASIILSVMEVPPPPIEYYRKGTLYYNYLAERFFYKYDFSDDRILATPLATHKFRTFSKIIAELDEKDAVPYVLDALRKSQVSPQQYSDLFDYLERDFGLVGSPFRKEPLYIAMLKYALAHAVIDSYREERFRRELKIINKNNQGDKLPNFNLIMSNGDTTALYDIQSDFLLLYFQNPDCSTCSKLRENMKKIKSLNKAVADKKITVLTIYFEKDKTLWQNYLQTDAAENWQHGWNYDLAIENDFLIDVRGIPTMYLLDKNKVVIKKDITFHELETYLERSN
ncbi:MAG: DUF5106 domain-containing protein [Lentimicrobiaceae bacterium]|nr:DUF5106 domain-containing protein [Lentimicrobiaceae bacterium]